MNLRRSCGSVALNGRRADAHKTLMRVISLWLVSESHCATAQINKAARALGCTVSTVSRQLPVKLQCHFGFYLLSFLVTVTLMSTISWWNWQITNSKWVCLERSGRGVEVARQWRHIVCIKRRSAQYRWLPGPEGVRCNPPVWRQFNPWLVPPDLRARQQAVWLVIFPFFI